MHLLSRISFFWFSALSGGCGSSTPVQELPAPPSTVKITNYQRVQKMPIEHLILHKRMQTGDYKRFAMKPETDVPEFRKLVKERYEARKPEVEALERQLKGQEVEEMAVRSPKTPKSRRRAVRFPKNLR